MNARWLLPLLLLIFVQGACVGGDVPWQQRARYRQLSAAIEARRSFDFHCWCSAYHGGLCGSQAAARLKLSASDVPLLEKLGSTDEYQVAAAVADLLASLGPPGREALARLTQRNDHVGEMLRGPALPGRYERCTTPQPDAD